jgi:hypothetical protein
MPQLHPLAQAFLAGKAEKEELEFRNRKQAEDERARLEDEAFRQEQAKAVENRFNEQRKHEQTREELDRQRFQFEKDRYLDQAKEIIKQQILTGARPRKGNEFSPEQMQGSGFMSGFVTPEVINDPRGFKMNLNEDGTPEAVGQAQAAIQRPVKEMQSEYDLTRINAQGENRNILESIKAAAAEKKAADERAFRASEGEKNRNSRLQAAGMRINTQQQKATASGVDAHPYDIIATGDAPIDSVTTAKNARLSAMTYAKTKGIGFYKQAEADQVANVKGALDQFNKVKDFAVLLMSEAPAEGNDAVLRGKKQGVFGKLWSQKLTNAYDEAVKTTAPGIARSLGEKGAFTDKDRTVWDNALPGFSKGDTDNWKGLRTAYDLAYTKAKNTLKDIKPEHREEFLRNKFNLVPVDEFAPPLYETVNGVKYKYDVKQGKYFPTKGGK